MFIICLIPFAVLFILVVMRVFTFVLNYTTICCIQYNCTIRIIINMRNGITLILEPWMGLVDRLCVLLAISYLEMYSLSCAIVAG